MCCEARAKLALQQGNQGVRQLWVVIGKPSVNGGCRIADDAFGPVFMALVENFLHDVRKRPVADVVQKRRQTRQPADLGIEPDAAAL